MSRAVIKRGNLMVNEGKVRRSQRALGARSDSEAVRIAVDRELATTLGLNTLPATDGTRNLRRRLQPDVGGSQVSVIPAGPVLFDTSAYIRQIREQAYPALAGTASLGRGATAPV